MTLYWAMHAPDRVVAKAREAIAASKHEGDDGVFAGQTDSVSERNCSAVQAERRRSEAHVRGAAL